MPQANGLNQIFIQAQGSAYRTGNLGYFQRMGQDVYKRQVTGQSAGSLVNIVQWVLDRELRFSLNFYRENNYTTAYQELNLEEGRIIDGMRAAYGAIEQRLPIYSLLGSLLDRANLLACLLYTSRCV